MKAIERRNDCESFEAKEFDQQTGDCETDGHYLCAGCKHIAPVHKMSEADTMRVYYPKEYDALVEQERLEEEARVIKDNQTENDICPKCSAPMFDHFTNSHHDAEKCGSPKVAVAFSTECG